MKKIYFMIIMTIFIAASAGILSDTADAASAAKNIIVFKDKNFEQAVRENLKKPKGNILKSDALKLKELYLERRNISNLEGIQYFKKLKSISIKDNSVKDITPLKSLTELTYLDASNNNIRDISVISNLKKLEILDVHLNMIKDISPVKNLSKLRDLYISDNPIKDLSPIKSLPQKVKLRYFDYDKEQTLIHKVNQIINEIIKPGMSDYEKERALYDYIHEHAYYKDTTAEEDPWEGYHSSSAYGLLINGWGVCNAYAEGMKLLLSAADIESIVAVGEALGDAHAWIIAKIEGNYYHMDPTWSYVYFNLTNEKMAQSHSFKESQYPKCTDITYNYYYYEFCKKNKINIKNYITIYGTVSLPNGKVAGEDTYITPELYTDNNTPDESDDYSYYINIPIPKGANSVSYSYDVPAANAGYYMRYTLYYGKELGYCGRGYYSENGTTPHESKAGKIYPGQNQKKEIHLELCAGKKISGTVTLPENVKKTANQDLIYITVKKVKDDDKLSILPQSYEWGTAVSIPTGQNSADFSITVPESLPGESYIISYDSKSYEGMISGYYATQGTTPYFSEAGSIKIKDHDVTDIKINISGGRTISGTIYLPDDMTAPSDGLGISIVFTTVDATQSLNYGKTNGFRTTAYYIIPEGKNSVDFSVMVPENLVNEGYKITYISDTYQDLVTYGFYHKGRAVKNLKSADPIVVRGGDVKDIKFILLSSKDN